MSTKTKYIYGLHAGDGVIRYIGRTGSTPHQRLWGHKSNARTGKTGPLWDWIREHGEDKIKALTLEEFIETEDNTAADRERFHILQHIDSGNLINARTRTGGWGTINRKEPKIEKPHHMLGKTHSDETKDKISEKLRWHAQQKKNREALALPSQPC